MECAEVAVCAEYTTEVKQEAPKIGLSVVYTSLFSSTAPNYTADCLAAKNAGADAMNIGSLTFTSVQRIFSDCATQGYKPALTTLGDTAYNPAIVTDPNLSRNSWFAWAGLPWFANTPATKRANAAIQKSYPGLLQNAQFFGIDYTVWAAGLLLEHAVKASGVTAPSTVTKDTIVKGLLALRNDNLDGFVGAPLTFQAGKPHHVACWFVVHVSDGTQALVDGGKPECIPGAAPSA
jgi:branched-chain amino acid transport system substrate-binding protein